MTKYILFLVGLGLLCAIIVAASFSITGNPASQKSINLDRARLSDFSSIKYTIESYYRQNGQLPNSLQDMSAITRDVLNDPETKQPYTYRKDSSNSYSLCTVFSTDSSALTSESDYYYGDSIKYSKGFSCITYNTNAYVPTSTPFIPTSTLFPSPTVTPISTLTPSPNPTSATGLRL
ncbi:hypothetical protein BH09PAT2_BH09PAT2_08040 [soil metagenome]